eukprot:scaffold3740_cov322-Prasinococcus_capsulatus_cf.AAC.10
MAAASARAPRTRLPRPQARRGARRNAPRDGGRGAELGGAVQDPAAHARGEEGAADGKPARRVARRQKVVPCAAPITPTGY